MSRSRTRRVTRVAAAAVAVAALGTAVGGCSQLYWDRRDPVGLSAGDAIAANEAVQTIDPWPRSSANTNLAFNGQRMQAAAERYRNNTVIQPVDPQAPQVAVAPTATQPSSSGGTTAGGTNGTTILLGAPAAAAAATP